jgi:hypothetical protein
MKIPMTLSGIEPATFRFVPQHLNHYPTAVPPGHWVTFDLLTFRGKVIHFQWFICIRRALRMGALRCLEVWDCPVMQRHIPQEPIFRLPRCENSLYLAEMLPKLHIETRNALPR